MKMLCAVQLSKHRYKTPEGYLVCKDCIIARTGKQTYLRSELYGLEAGEDEYVDVDRKPEQVFDEKTMASFEGKPLTIEHPDVSVSPDNYKDLSVGNVHNVHKGEFEGQEVMLADINVYDAKAIELIESGEMEELSCGYDCDITDGPNPEQINIRGNHVALCEQGRAGIARIQDSIPNQDLREINSSISYHYRTDMANDLDMSKFGDRMIWEYLPNELSRQLTDEEKKYVREKIKSYISDHWGAKPVVKDSVQKGTLIQEFGSYGKQYRIAKIQGNVLYCEELSSGKVSLFKKDKENADWAIITKADVKDSAPSEEKRYRVTNFPLNRGRYFVMGDGLTLEEAERLFDQVVSSIAEKNESSSFAHMTSVFLDEDTEYFNEHVIKSADIDGEGKIYYSGKRTTAGDSFARLFVISLPEGEYLDENDRPTKDINKARRFETRDEAEAYRKVYCNGEVREIKAHVRDSKLEAGDIERVREMISGTEHGDISHDEEMGVIDIYFDDRKEMRKAARKLIRWYDLEMEEAEGELCITLYDKYDEERGISLTEDSSEVDFLKGKPAEEFKDYLAQRGMRFADSENGDFIRFSVEGADEDVFKKIRSINDDYSKAGLFDDYSKRFYIKAIKALEEKLDKLERNELLDANQRDYQIQKEKMAAEIRKQIEQYKKRLNAI